MKINRYIYILALLGFSLAGCSDFLEEKSQDIITPKTTEDYSALFAYEFYSNLDEDAIKYMTDDIVEVEESKQPAQKELVWSYYTWQKDISLAFRPTQVKEDNMWGNMYKNIAIVNNFIEDYENIEGSPGEKQYLLGEAYFVRGREYLSLVNIYGSPYNASNLNVSGVPVITEPEINLNVSRATTHEVYLQVERDLLKSMEQFEGSGITKSTSRPNVAAAQLLLSRIYLYMGRWQDCIEWSTKLIENSNHKLWDIANFPTVPVVSTNNSELIHNFGRRADADNFMSSRSEEPHFKVSDGLMALYQKHEWSHGDKRKQAYLKQDGWSWPLNFIDRKSTSSFSTLTQRSYRLVEAYYNRAEAHLNNGSANLTVEDLKTVLITRMKNFSDEIIPTDEILLKTFLQEQRRIELSFEVLRFFDLKRMKSEERPEIVHPFSEQDQDGNVVEKKIYKLPKDASYIIALPNQEIVNNPNIETLTVNESIVEEVN